MASLPPYSPPSESRLSRAQSKALANHLPFTNLIHTHPNTSSYTLRTIPINDTGSPSSPTAPSTPLRSDVTRNYGATPTTASFLPLSPGVPSLRRPLLNAAIKMAVLFVVSCLVLGGTLWIALPTLEVADRPLLHIPKSFDQLQALNGLLKKYRDIYPYRIIICYITTYLFLQAFSLPGSMYLSILGGAVWGVARAIPLACTCVATGATLCYLISAALGPALLAMPKWKERLDRWAEKVDAQRANLISFLIVLRIAPLPPHWVVNVICPHVGIGIPIFWLSTWLGILGVTTIHTTIGSGLDEMTSADDFHLISWRNFFGLAAIVVAVLIPVGLRYVWKKELQGVAQADAGVASSEVEEEARLFEYADEDESEDEVLQAGPTSIGKGKNVTAVLGDGVDGDARLVLMQDEDEEPRDVEFYPDGASSDSEDESVTRGKGNVWETPL